MRVDPQRVALRDHVRVGLVVTPPGFDFGTAYAPRSW
jgi:hypothetical protein